MGSLTCVSHPCQVKPVADYRSCFPYHTFPNICSGHTLISSNSSWSSAVGSSWHTTTPVQRKAKLYSASFSCFIRHILNLSFEHMRLFNQIHWMASLFGVQILTTQYLFPFRQVQNVLECWRQFAGLNLCIVFKGSRRRKQLSVFFIASSLKLALCIKALLLHRELEMSIKYIS